MPASPALAPRGRVRRLAAGVCTSALAAITVAPAAVAADRELTVGSAGAASGRAVPRYLGALRPGHADAVRRHGGGRVRHDARARRRGGDALARDGGGRRGHAGRRPLRLPQRRVRGGRAARRRLGFNRARGERGRPGRERQLPRGRASPSPPAVRASAAARRWHRAAPTSPTSTRRAAARTPSSATRRGAASQPAVALTTRRWSRRYRVFADPAVYSSRIATAVSFDRGERWQRLGTSRPGRTPRSRSRPRRAAGHRRGGRDRRCGGGRGRPSAMCCATGRGRRRRRSPRPARRDRRAPRDRRARRRALACWVRTTDLGAFARQAVQCRRSEDRGTTWDEPQSLTPAAVPGVPFGPYVGGVAVAARRGVFSVAWVDTLAGTLDGSGLDSAWVVTRHRSAGARRAVPAAARALRRRQLPQRRPALARRGSRRALSRVCRRGRRPGGRPRALHRHALGRADRRRWRPERRRPVPAERRRRRRDEVHVLFLDRRLDPSGTFADEWLASSYDGGDTWSAAAALARLLGPGDRRAALAHRRPPRRPPGAGRRPLRRDRAGRGHASRQRAARDLDFDKGRRVADGSAAVRVDVGPVVRRSVRGVSTKERIQELADQITALRDSYYRGSPSVADAEYDAIEDELRALIDEQPGARARSEPAGAGRRAVGAARADPALAADALAREGDQARAGRGVLRPLPRPAGGRDAQARRALAGAGLRGRAARAGDHARGRDDRRRRDHARARAGGRRAGAGRRRRPRRGARRGGDAALDVRGLQRGAPGQAADQPAQRRRGHGAGEGPGRGRRAPPALLRVRPRRLRGRARRTSRRA